VCFSVLRRKETNCEGNCFAAICLANLFCKGFEIKYNNVGVSLEKQTSLEGVELVRAKLNLEDAKLFERNQT